VADPTLNPNPNNPNPNPDLCQVLAKQGKEWPTLPLTLILTTLTLTLTLTLTFQVLAKQGKEWAKPEAGDVGAGRGRAKERSGEGKERKGAAEPWPEE